jgi:hypothetical protein
MLRVGCAARCSVCCVACSMWVWLCAGTSVADGAAAADAQQELRGTRCRAVFSEVDGSLVSLSSGESPQPILRGGEEGLWCVRFQDGSQMSASDFRTANATRRCSVSKSADGSALTMTFESPELQVAVTAVVVACGIELTASVEPQAKTVVEFVVPGRLRFEPERLQRVVAPLTPHLGVGVALQPSFFTRQGLANPTAWQTLDRGGRGYVALLGQGPVMHDWDAAPTRLRVTDAGRQWFGPALAEKLNAASARVTRPFVPSQAELVLLDSEAGPYLAANALGGSGRLWRVGGRVDEAEAADALSAVVAIVDRLASAPSARKRLALVHLANGPPRGEACAVTIEAWGTALRATAQARGLTLDEVASPEAMVAAADRQDILAILNPYGEALPVPRDASLVQVVEAIRRYVRAGGNWFEVGGYSFYGSLRPVDYLRFEGQYPPLFADFLHLDTDAGAASVYGVQPRTWQPWEGAAHHEAIFVPGRLALGGDEAGGWYEHAFGTFVPAGQPWAAPRVRIAIGAPADASLREYCRANNITRPLDDKLPPALRSPLRQAMLIKLMGTAREQIAALPQLPAPALIHFTEYLQGGFDKQYPDHLPPAPRFGTPADLRALCDRAHELGHLVMPYTNPTWWCDHPRGPTFVRAGDAPLLRDLSGSLSPERYGNNDGYTTCLWHPAVRAVNRETVRQFTEDYPVDILFQDQCGARTWQYDTNPAAPTPYAYAEGMISMVEEDCRRAVLGTEDGFDRIVNAEAQMCGFTFGLVPGHNPDWARGFKKLYPPGTWQIYPVAQYIAHDKAALLHHDLGKFVTDRSTLSWTLGLGFAMSYAIRARDVARPDQREWLLWLDRLQKSVCARYVGEPVQAFEHQQPAELSTNDGVIHATYGPVRLVANLGSDELRDAGHELAGFGFYAESPGMVAANLRRLSALDLGEEGISFVTEATKSGCEIWLYATGGQEVAVLLPPTSDGTYTLTVDNEPPTSVRATENAVRLRLPGATTGAKRLWHAAMSNDE